jgi:hypothetical protein
MALGALTSLSSLSYDLAVIGTSLSSLSYDLAVPTSLSYDLAVPTSLSSLSYDLAVIGTSLSSLSYDLAVLAVLRPRCPHVAVLAVPTSLSPRRCCLAGLSG